MLGVGGTGSPGRKSWSSGWEVGQRAFPVCRVGSGLSVTLGSRVTSQLCGWPAV